MNGFASLLNILDCLVVNIGYRSLETKTNIYIYICRERERERESIQKICTILNFPVRQTEQTSKRTLNLKTNENPHTLERQKQFVGKRSVSSVETQKRSNRRTAMRLKTD